MKITLGQRVYADKVYVLPDRSRWKSIYEAHEEDTPCIIEMAPIDNTLADKAAIVVGESRRRYKGEIKYYCEGDGGFTCGSEGYGVAMDPTKRSFIAIRYTLRGGMHFTLPEYVREVNSW